MKLGYNKFNQNSSINKISLILIVILDIFILINILSGISSISQWYIDPSAEVHCYSQITNERDTLHNGKFYIINNIYKSNYSNNSQTNNSQIGKKSTVCDKYDKFVNNIKNSNEYISLFDQLDSFNLKNYNLNNVILDTRKQYDSSLLENISRLPQNKSINNTPLQRMQKNYLLLQN